MSQIRGIKISLKQLMDSDAPDASVRHWVVPKKATVLSNNGGTLIEDETGEHYLVTIGEWFRSPYNGKAMPQVDQFNKLQDLGFTVIKDRMFRHEEEQKKELEVPVVKAQPVIKPVVKNNGQALRSQNNVGSKKISQTVATNPASEKKD